MAENKLKSCPFCGGEAYIKTAISLDDLGAGHVVVACALCCASVSGQTKEQAIKAWNKQGDGNHGIQADRKGS